VHEIALSTAVAGTLVIGSASSLMEIRDDTHLRDEWLTGVETTSEGCESLNVIKVGLAKRLSLYMDSLHTKTDHQTCFHHQVETTRKMKQKQKQKKNERRRWHLCGCLFIVKKNIDITHHVLTEVTHDVELLDLAKRAHLTVNILEEFIKMLL